MALEAEALNEQQELFAVAHWVSVPHDEDEAYIRITSVDGVVVDGYLTLDELKALVTIMEGLSE